MLTADIVGFIGAVLITFTFIPQLIKTYKTKKAGDLSLLMILISSAGSLIYIFYGYMIKSNPILVMNIAFIIINLCLLFLKVKYDQGQKIKGMKK